MKSCIHGHNIRKYFGKTVKECKGLCIAEPKCQAIEYGVAYGGGGSYKPKECQLQNGNNPTDCDGAHHNLDLYIKRTSCKSDGKFLLIFKAVHTVSL